MSSSSLSSSPVAANERRTAGGVEAVTRAPRWLRGRGGPARHLLLRWGIPAFSSLLAALLTEWLQPLLTPGRFLLFLTAVVVSAWCGGLPAGLLATALGALGHACLLLPPGHAPGAFERSNWFGLLLFLPVGTLVSELIGALHAARREAQALAKALRERLLQLAEADRRKDEFLAVLGHELRNPLGTACHALHVFHLRDDAPTVRWARGVAERQVQLLSRLVDDLFDNSRVACGKVLLHREHLDLARLVRRTLADYAPVLQGAGLALRRDLPEGPAWVEGDPTRLSQVLGNLLQNAVKFTDRGGQVVIGLAVDAERRRATVTVRDTGIGIEGDLLSRVFESYAQEERGRGRSGGGLGLGLALVKGMVELHGGEVAAASPGSGRGAEFSFWLPLAGEPAPLRPGHPAPGGAPKKSLRILLIDDERDAAESLQTLLGLCGHEVAVAHSGSAGLALARELRPDVVLCDLGLPGMDGFAVARALRQEPATAAARLFVLSGYAGAEDRRRGLEAGFDQYLVKPVELAELERLLAAVPAGTAASLSVQLPGRSE